MRSQQAKIVIVVTKAGSLQARVIPVAANEPPFEVALGGNEWMSGKGSKYYPIILEKATALVESLKKQLAEIVRDVEPRQPYTCPVLQGEVMKTEKEAQPNQERRLNDRRCNHIQNNIGKRSALRRVSS
jgi:hypothetical protein